MQWNHVHATAVKLKKSDYDGVVVILPVFQVNKKMEKNWDYEKGLCPFTAKQDYWSLLTERGLSDHGTTGPAA